MSDRMGKWKREGATLLDNLANDEPRDSSRRAMLRRLGVSGSMFAYTTGFMAENAYGAVILASGSHEGYYDVRKDFNGRGDGKADDTRALQNAINAGSAEARPIRMAPGAYRITQPLAIPTNTMLVGSSPGLGFGCRIEPMDCAAFVIGGKSPSFHCSIENLMIWPRGSAPEYLVSIDNSYSVTFRNIRIHEAQDDLKRAAVLLLGDQVAGGHGPCMNIIWDNLIVRNDSRQPPVAILATKGCGSHRFIAPDLENYRVLVEWQGGQLDLVAPYTERAGQYAVNCNIDSGDDRAYFNTFGGSVDTASSGLGCAIRETTRNFNSFGTQWGATSARAAHVYSLPSRRINFHGIEPNLSNTGTARFSGVNGWLRFVNFTEQSLRSSRSMEIAIPAHSQTNAELQVPGVSPGEHWARVMVNRELQMAQLSAHVSDTDTVRIVAVNGTDRQISLSGTFTVECGIA